MSKLKPCPFCGSEAKLIKTLERNDDGFHIHAVACLNNDCIASNLSCLCYGKKTKNSAIEAWNLRPYPPKCDVCKDFGKHKYIYCEICAKNEARLNVYSCYVDLNYCPTCGRKLESERLDY